MKDVTNFEVGCDWEFPSEFVIRQADWLRTIGFQPAQIMFISDEDYCIIEQIFCQYNFESKKNDPWGLWRMHKDTRRKEV